ncbi:MAG TPA: response regulator transcription factor [Polyangiaceae bacterium]
MHSGLTSLLGSEPDFSIVPEGDADLALLDVGPRAAAHDRGALARTPTLALVRDEDSALNALRAGAQGVLLRSVDSERIVSALRAVAMGLGVFDPILLRSLLSARAALPEALALTPREAEVLSLMAEGLSNKLIAERLKISDHTVKFHVNAILNKLGAETRTEAVVQAARRGLLML